MIRKDQLFRYVVEIINTVINTYVMIIDFGQGNVELLDVELGLGLGGILDFLVMIIEFGQGIVELGLGLGDGCIGRLPHSLDR